jgi:hypothetical protein
MLFVPAYATEFAILEKTVDFVAALGGNTNYFRIEALRNENGDYATRVYIRMQFAMKDAMIIEDSEEIQAEQDRYVWVDFPDAPYSHGKNADDAINFQMSLLSDRLKRP